MDELHTAGVDEIAVSWWGRGSPEDRAPARCDRRGAARGASRSRRTSSRTPDVRSPRRSTTSHYLHGLGIRTFYVYRALELPSLDWLAANATLRAEGDTHDRADRARRRGRDGGLRRHLHLRHRRLRRRQVHAPLQAGAQDAPHLRTVGRAGLRRAARQRRPDDEAAPKRRDLRPHVARGDRGARRPRDDHVVQRVARGHPDRARGPPGRHGRYRYLSYDGAWGLHGRPPSTRTWCGRATGRTSSRSTSPAQPSTKPS